MKELNRITLVSGIIATFFIFSLLIFPAMVLAGVEIISPTDGETISGITPIVVSYSGTELLPVYYVYCSVAGGYWIEPPELSGSHIFFWDTTGGKNGTQYTIQVYANWAGSPGGAGDTVTVTIANEISNITLTRIHTNQKPNWHE
jgi:hypothetical protein